MADPTVNTLPNGVLLSYGTFKFPAHTQWTLESRVVYDEANRARVGIRYLLSTLFYVYGTAAENNTPAINIAMQQTLETPRQNLVILGLTIGDMVVTPLSRNQDMDWGPKPHGLLIQPLGGTGFEVRWACEFFVAACRDGSSSSLLGLVSLNVAQSFSIDQRGLCTRTVNGSLKIIPNVGSRDSATQTAHQAFQLIRPEVPTGFQRVATDTAESMDKSTLQFTFRDQELATDDYYPPGIVGGDLTFETENIDNMSFINWNLTINCDWERAPGTPRDYCWTRFLIGCSNVYKSLVDPKPKLPPKSPLAAQLKARGKPIQVILDKIRLSVSKHSRRSSFSISARALGTGSTGLYLEQLGIWKPLGTDYQTWKTSMDKLWGPYGYAGLNSLPNQDVILSICDNQQPTPRQPNSLPTPPSSSYPPSGVFPVTPKPSDSYMTYQNRLKVKSKQEAAIATPVSNYRPLSPSGSTPEDATADVSATLPLSNTDNKQSSTSQSSKSTGDVSTQIQYAGVPTTEFEMIGGAIRIGYNPSVPQLASVGGYVVKLVESEIDGPIMLGENGDVPIMGISWKLKYLLTNQPSGDLALYGMPTPFVS